MNTFEDLKKIMEEVNNRHQMLLLNYGNEKISGLDTVETMKQYNALAISIDDACDILRKGLKGSF